MTYFPLNLKISYHVQVRLRDRGFRSMTDIREQVKNELVHSSERMHGIAQVG